MFDGIPNQATDRAISKKKPASWRRGKKIDKTSQTYLDALAAAQAPLPPIDTWTFGEVQLFHNLAPGRCQTEFVLKLAATTEGDFEKLTSASRRRLCTERWAPLSTAQQFAHNLTPSRSPVSPEERPVVDNLLAAARGLNRVRTEGQPPCLLGFVGQRFHGAGTVRNAGCFAFVTWVQRPGAEIWYPVVYVSALTDDPLVLDPPPITTDRHAKASAWLSLVYSPAYRRHLVTLREAALARDARKAAA